MILGVINGYLRSKAIIRLSQHGFMKRWLLPLPDSVWEACDNALSNVL